MYSRVKMGRSFASEPTLARCRARNSHRITVDYTVEFSRVLRDSSPGAAFSFLSGNGADPTRTKPDCVRALQRERLRNAVLAAGFPHVYLFRPAYIYPVKPRNEPNFSYRLLRTVYPVFRVLFPNQGHSR